ncbi:MAG: Calx-beta domain-containing protein, partial [Chloroflexota bacterium]
MKSLIGQQIGPYQIEALLGEGGMGMVYRAHDLKNDRIVAIKIMLANLVNKPQFRSRFMQEAEAIGQFNSPAIVKVLATGVHEEAPYIVMEYIEGGSLTNYMRQLEWAGSRPPVAMVVTIAAQIAEGLSYAHQRGLIHRDIKPGNILLKMREGVYQPRQAVITDFGLAVQRKDGDEMDTAPFMGSLAYMSPEQCENKPLDGRSDIYSLGIVLYQLATGKLPFQINAPADIVKHLEETPLPPRLINPDLPEIVETITLKAMEKKPGSRYQSAAEMAHALRQALNSPEWQTAVLTAASPNSVTQWLDNKWIAAIVVEDRVDMHQTWTSLGQNRLFIVHQWEESRVVGLDKDDIILGRDSGCDVVLADQSVSSKHIRLTRTPQGWSVSDLGSTNHTYFGQRQLDYGQSYDWPSTEELRVGPYFLRWQPFEANQRQPEAAPILAGTMLAGAAGITLAGTALAGAELPASDVAAAAARTTGYSDGEILGIAIMPDALELEPNSQSLLQISITNRDITVKDVSLRLEVDGRPPAWVSLSDYQMKLLPDENKTTSALIDLSQAPTILADTHVVTLIATTDRGEVEMNQVGVIIKSQEEFVLDLHPSNLQEKITCRLTISDHSNFQNEYTIMGIDDSDALVFDFDEPQNAILVDFKEQQQQIKVAPRQEAWVGFRIRPRKRPLLGANKTLPFKIRVRTPASDWQSLNGQVEIYPRITRRLLLFLLLLFLLVGGAGYLAFYQYQTAQAERVNELQNQLAAAQERAAAARGQLEDIEAQIEAAREAGASEEELALLEAARLAALAELEEASADADILSDEVGGEITTASIDPAAAATAAAEAAAAAAAEATAAAALFTPTPVPNNPPTGIAFSATSVTENVPIGSVVGQFTAQDPDVAAGDGQPVVVNRSRLSRVAAQSSAFTFSLVSGSGSTHNDYFAINGSQLVTAAEIDYEKTPSLSFRVQVTDAGGATFAQSFTLAVTDQDDIPALSVANLIVSEADGTAELTVVVSGSNFDVATVNYATTDGTAVAGEDYTATSGTLTWAKGNTDNQIIKIPLLDNQIDQPDRTFVVTLSGAVNATISSGSATITITDDDAPPTISVANLTVSESVTGGKATITVQMTGASSEIVSVDYATVNGTATAGASGDYIAANGTLTWNPKETGARTFGVTINIDNIDESDEDFRIVLSGVKNAALSSSEAIITISDDNNAPRIVIGDVTVTEGDVQITVPVTMTGRSSSEAWVEYSTSNGSGSNAATSDFPDPDFNPTIGRLTWEPGTEGVKTITVQINDDDIYESSPEIFVVSLFDNSASVVLQDNLANIYIIENDSPPQIAITSATAVTANESQTTHQVALSLTGRSSNPITLAYRTNGGTATPGRDYVDIPSGSVTWAGLDASAKTINVTIINDAIDENPPGSPTPQATETFTFDLESVASGNATIDAARKQVVFTIVDNDTAAINVSGPAPATITEATPPESAAYTFVLGSQPETGSVVLNVAVTDENPNDGIDQCSVSVLPVNFTVDNWNRPQTVTVRGNDDLYVDGPQECWLVVTPTSTDPLYGAFEVFNTSDNPITVADNDVPNVVVSTNLTAMYENPISGTNTITYLMRLATIPLQPVTVNLSHDAQVTVSAATLVFPASLAATTNQTVTVTAVNDQVDELLDPHTSVISHTASGGGYGGVAIDAVTVSITDDDTAGVVVSPPALSTITEGGGITNTTFTVALTSQPLSAINMSFAATSTTSTRTQCSVFPTSASFTAINAPQTFTITAVNDDIVDGDHDCVVETAVTGGDSNYTSLNPNDVTVTVTDDDVAGYTVSTTTLAITDTLGSNTGSFQVFLTSQPEADVTITYASSNPVCTTNAITFTALGGSWQSGLMVNVTAAPDDIANANRTCALTPAVATADANYSPLTPAPVTVTVLNDDIAGYTVSTNTLAITDTVGSTSSTFNVRLTSQPEADVNLQYTSSSTVCSVSVSGLLTAANWNSGVTVTVSTPANNIDEGPDSVICTLTSAVTTTDPNYNSAALPPLSPGNVTVTVYNDDVAGYLVTPTALIVTDTVGLNVGTITVRLTSQPTANVTLTFASSNPECTVSVSGPLTAANWNTTGVTVTVTGAVDNIADADTTCIISASVVTTTDTVYAALSAGAVPTVSVTVQNDEAVAVVVSPTTLNVTDSTGQNTAQFNVRLSSQPSADVSISLTIDRVACTTNPLAVVIPAASWNTGVNVTVTAPVNDI